jgi:hypothetical protein
MLTVLSKVWDAVSGGLTDRFLERVFGPALYFWGVGGAAVAWDKDLSASELFEGLKEVGLADGVLYAAVGAIVLVLSNSVMEALQFGVLRILEGYWPAPLSKLLTRRIKSVRDKVSADRNEWEALAQTYTSHTAEQRQRYRKLDRRRDFFPSSPHQLKPTILGNVLAAAESYAWDRYGLASVLMWSRLWLVMDDGSRTEVTNARKRLNVAVQLLTWSVLILVWTWWAWWALVVSVVAAVIMYRLAVGAASGYGELMKAAFDVHHRALLNSVGLLKKDEGFVPHDRGRSLTMFIKRGIRPGPEAGEPRLHL